MWSRWNRYIEYLLGAGKRSGRQPPEYETPAVADELYLDMIVRRADIQYGQLDAIDSKSATAFAAASGLLPITLGILSLTNEQRAQITALEVWLILVAMLFYVLLAACFYLGYRLIRIEIPPGLRFWNELYNEDPMRDRAEIVAALGNSLLTSIHKNEELIEIKVFYAKATMALLFTEVAILTALAFLKLL